VRNLFGLEQLNRDSNQSRSSPSSSDPFSKVAGQVISALAARQQCARQNAELFTAVSLSEVRSYTTLALEESDAVVNGFVTNILARGVSVEQIYLNLLAPSARLLGEYWCEDKVGFSRVTIALWRLQQSLFLLEDMDQVSGASASSCGSVFLATAPGSQHTFGLQMLGDLLRRRGWSVNGGTSADAGAVVKAVRSQHFDVIGFSIGSTKHFQSLRDLLVRCRKSSVNANAALIVGGAAVSDVSVDWNSCAADLICRDPDRVVAEIDSFFARRQRCAVQNAEQYG
jgi:MerR family transcriptional regulator, light-induced transcriptional regulator